MNKDPENRPRFEPDFPAQIRAGRTPKSSGSGGPAFRLGGPQVFLPRGPAGSCWPCQVCPGPGLDSPGFGEGLPSGRTPCLQIWARWRHCHNQEPLVVATKPTSLKPKVWSPSARQTPARARAGAGLTGLARMPSRLAGPPRSFCPCQACPRPGGRTPFFGFRLLGFVATTKSN